MSDRFEPRTEWAPVRTATYTPVDAEMYGTLVELFAKATTKEEAERNAAIYAQLGVYAVQDILTALKYRLDELAGLPRR
jgi:hypothetical protein